MVGGSTAPLMAMCWVIAVCAVAPGATGVVPLQQPSPWPGASQPSVLLALQSKKPVLHAPLYVQLPEPLQEMFPAATFLTAVEQSVPQVPQWFRLLLRFTSQPSLVSALQSAKLAAVHAPL